MTKIPKLLFATFLFIQLSVKAQVGTPFPTLTGKTLTDKTLTIPTDTKNKFTLVGMAYSQKSDEYLRGWMQPVFDTFLDKKTLWTYDVNIYFIPMVGGVKQVAAETIEKKLRENIDKTLHPNILFYKGDVASYKKTLNFDGKDKPYFYIIDKAGKIVYSTSGEYSDKKMEAIEEKLESVME